MLRPSSTLMVPARYEHDDILTDKRQELGVIKTAVVLGLLVAFFSLVRGATSDGASRERAGDSWCIKRE